MKLTIPLRILAVLSSIPLTWLWIHGGRDLYGAFFAKAALPIYGLLGMTDVMPLGARDRFLNYMPFVILMLITPRLSRRRRILGIAIGCVLIFFGHVAFVVVAARTWQPDNTINVRGFESFLPALLLCDALPLILWALFANEFLREHMARIFAAEGSRDGP